MVFIFKTLNRHTIHPAAFPLDISRISSITLAANTCIHWLKHMSLKLLRTSYLSAIFDELFNNVE